MEKASRYKILMFFCFVYVSWCMFNKAINGLIFNNFDSVIFHSFFGITANIALILGFLFLFLHKKAAGLKTMSFLYHENKKQHILNWVIFILACVCMVIFVTWLMYDTNLIRG